ncbi:hypothetical protein JW968_04865 [Candidatus Woesearchaeota archaeon]|nr:hypothetical protein [Candidatus Woesearchaeota archaeon]
MDRKVMFVVLSVSLFSIVFFLGASINAFVVSNVDPDDLCGSDTDCDGRKCCIIYPDKDLGLCMDSCQSMDFLCTSADDCADGICCGIESDYGVCADSYDCATMAEIASYMRTRAVIESPAPVDFRNNVILVETVLLALLVIFVIYLMNTRRD